MAIESCTGACCSTACLAGAKAGLAAVLTVEALAVIWVGAWLSRRAKASHLANAFASGVFLTSVLVHGLPHATEVLNGGHDDEADSHAAGADNDLDALDDHDDHAGHDHRLLLLSRQETDSHDDHGHSEPFPTANIIALGTLLVLLFLETVVMKRFGGGHGHANEKVVDADEPNTTSTCSDEESPPAADADTAARGDEPAARFFSPALWTAAITVLGIALHSFVESVSFGLAPSLSSVLSLFAAVAAHRWIVAIAVLARLTSVSALAYRQRTVLFLCFVAVLPLGVAIGAGLSRLPGKVEGVLGAASAGTFLYLGFEGLFEEMMAHKKWLSLKFVAILLGVGMIITVDVILRAAGVSH